MSCAPEALLEDRVKVEVILENLNGECRCPVLSSLSSYQPMRVLAVQGARGHGRAWEVPTRKQPWQTEGP